MKHKIDVTTEFGEKEKLILHQLHLLEWLEEQKGDGEAEEAGGAEPSSRS
jgi:hypothetical protein